MAQERCVRSTYQYGRLWKPGEVRTAGFDDDGEPQASDHFRLVEEDERVEDRDVYDEEQVKESRKAAGLRDKRTAINNALYDLDPDDDSHWTSKGWPAIQAVFSRVDFEVSRNEITAVQPDFNRDKARELKTNEG